MNRFQKIKEKFRDFMKNRKSEYSETDKAFLVFDRKNKKIDRFTYCTVIIIIFVGFIFWAKISVNAGLVFLGFAFLLILAWLVWFSYRYIKFMRAYQRKDK